MANTLMFEVGIKQAVAGLSEVKKELDQFITDYTKKMQIQVDIKNLETFITALKSIGNGEQLKPLLDQVERLQNRLGAMTDKGQYFDMLRGEAAAAAKAVEIAEQQLNNMKKTGNVNLISNARTNLEQAQQEAARTAEVLASATERFAKEEARAAATTTDTKQKIDALGQSVAELHTKIGNGININLSGDFSKWAKEVQSVTASVRELVEQLKKMHTATATSAKEGLEPLLSQAQVIERLKNKYNELLKKKADCAGLMPTIGIDRELKDLEQKLPSAQAKFNESLEKGASVANSYAQAIQQLGQKYNHTGEQAQKLAEIIASGQLSTGNVQRGLKVGFNQATDIVNTIEALQKLKQEESKPAPQGGLFDPQQFKVLQEAIDAVIREINRLKEAFAGVGEIRGLSQLTESMNALFHNVSTFKDVFATLSAAVNLTPTSEYVKKLQTDFEAAQAKVKELTEKLTALAAAQNNVAETASKAGKSEKQIGDSQAALFNRYNKLLADIQNIKREIVEIQRGAGGGGPSGGELGKYFSALNQIRNSIREITSAPSVAEAIQRGMSSERLSKLTSALAALKAGYKEAVSEANDFNKATDKGSSQAEARIRKLGMAFNELKNYMKQNGGSEEMKRLQQEIQAAIRKMRELMNAGNHSEAVNVYERLTGIIRQATSATKEYEKSQQKAISTTNQLSESEQRLANAIKSSTDSMRGQSQVLSDLKSMAVQYLSVWGAQNFLNKIIETGGQLEQQRLSMGAILQDAEKADEIFGQIKALAVKSPFGVVQLDQMSKQLAAYSFEAEELFDWTKRLADISAATGTEVSRLALALGHVRSEGALSGYTLRQFSMGNVPLLKMLSQNRGVSAKEIRDLVRKKEISDKEVMEMLQQLTNEGGMFYNAQEVMSQALNARFKNLRDAFDIMYGEIAESPVGDVLKEIAITLTDGAKQWKRFGADILFVGTALGVAKVAMLMYNAALGKGTAATLRSALAAKKKEVANLELTASYRQLSFAEERTIVNANKLNSTNISTLLTTKKLTYAELERAVALGKVNKNTALAGLYMAGMKDKMVMLRRIAPLTGFARAWALIGYNVKMAGMAVKSFMASLAPLLAITAVFDLIMKNNQDEDRAEQAAESASKATNKYKEIIELNESLQVAEGQTDEELQKNIDTMTNALRKTGDYTEELEKQISTVTTLSEKYNVLRDAIDNASVSSKDKQERKQNILNEAFMLGDGSWVNPLNWFSDTFLKDTQDYGEYLQDAKKILDTYSREIRALLVAWMKENNQWSEDFIGKSAHDIFFALSEANKTNFLSDNSAASGVKELYRIWFGYGSGGVTTSPKTVTGARNEIERFKDEYIKAMEDAFHVDYPMINLDDATYEEKKEFAKFVKETHAGVEGMSQEIQDYLNSMVIEGRIRVKAELALEPSWIEEGTNKQLDYMGSSPIGYGFYIGNMTKSLQGKGEFFTIDEVQKAIGDFKASNYHEAGEKLNKRLKEIEKENTTLKAIGHKTKEIEEQIAKNDKEARIIKAFTKDQGLDLSIFDKSSGKGGSQEDKAAKALRERVRILKEAEQAYQYWRKAVGGVASIAHVNEEFGQLLSEQGYSFENIEHYKKTLEDLRAEYQAIYDVSEKAGQKRPQLLEAIKEIDKVLADISRKDFEKSTEDFVSSMTREIDELSRKWEIFNSVVESTGDRMLAARMSGITPGATPADLKRANVAAFAEVGINFDKVLGLSDKEIDEYVYSLGIAEEKIKAVQNGLKDWKKAQQDLTKSDIQNYAKWLGGLVDLQTIRNRNQEEYNRILEETNRLEKEGVITQGEAERRKGAAQLNQWEKNWQASNMYKNLYKNAQVMGKNEFMEAYRTEMWYLNEELKKGAITTEQYDEKVQKLNKVMQEFSTSGFLGINGGVGAYLNGGYQGLINYHLNKASELRTNNNTDEAENEEKKALAMMKTQKAAEQLAKVFDDLSKGADLLANMFSALGMTGAANAFGDAAGVLGGIAGGANSLSGLGPWGMAAGAVIGGITSVAQLHDKQQERVIAALKEEVSALEANTEAIERSRERTLGYDSGELRRRMETEYAQYNKRSVFGFGVNSKYGAAGQAMAEYYSSNSRGDSYAQELNNLEKLRKDYIDMYNAEEDKKDSSREALQEYTEKIAELDDQIMFFTEDLAKELWDIDIKSWADQLSDALMTAWENGEDAAKAFDDTVADIMKNVVNNMMKIGYVEPLMQSLRESLFGENGAVQWRYDNNGQRTGIDWESSRDNFAKTVNDALGEGGWLRKELTQNYPEMMDDIQSLMPDIDMKAEDESSSTGSSIKGITEQTADLLASYLNAVRADVSVDRQMIADYFPMYLSAMTSANQSLASIESHTAAIMRSNDAIASSVTELQGDIRGLKNKTWKMPIA